MIEFPLLPSGEKPIWDGKVFRIGDRVTRVLAYSTNFAGWDDNLTELHEIEAGDGAHPIDVASRISALNSIQDAGFPQDGSILEVGCSSGFLLRDIKKAFPQANIVGADIVVKPLERLRVVFVLTVYPVQWRNEPEAERGTNRIQTDRCASGRAHGRAI